MNDNMKIMPGITDQLPDQAMPVRIPRAERRRQEREKKKETVYHLTKSQIDAIKRQAIDECMKEFKDLDLKIRAEYERQLDARYLDMQQQLNDRRIKDINFILPVALMACYDVFHWKVYRGDHYQRLLARMADILNEGDMTVVEIRRWVYKNLGIEMKEVLTEEE